MYQAACEEKDADGNNLCTAALYNQAMMGIARCTMRLGNIRQGIRLANQLNDTQLFIDCGDILEQQKQYSEAASLYINASQYEKAARIYTKYLIKDKSRITEAAVIMQKVDNDHLNSDFAKACEAIGRYEDAAKAYERAKDFDKVFNIN
jgi:WD repeat-containing protein 19